MRGAKPIPMIGKQFGELLVVSRAENVGKKLYWNCRCSCGVEKKVRGDHLHGGRVISCGHVGQAHSRDAKIKHDATGTRLYNVWYDMRARCKYPGIRCYKNYGGRGIRVCEEWEKDFSAFQDWAYANGYDENAPYGECTLDRIDVDGPYSPDNCRWATALEQAKNKRPRQKKSNRREEKC